MQVFKHAENFISGKLVSWEISDDLKISVVSSIFFLENVETGVRRVFDKFNYKIPAPPVFWDIVFEISYH